jgi:hypothetical protein
MLAIAAPMLAAYAASAGEACFPTPHAAYALDSSGAAPYIFKAFANNSYVNTYMNGTTFQTGVIKSSKTDADGACLVTASAVVSGMPPANLALRTYASEKFGSLDICYAYGETPAMPTSCVDAKMFAMYKTIPA